MAKMSQEEIVKAANSQLSVATGFDEDIITQEREKALDYYFMRPRGDEVKGRSQVISGDLSAMVEAVLSQMLDSFSTDNIVAFEPDGEGDEDQAQLESDTVSHFVMDANNGYIAFLEAIKDALLLRNGIIKVWVDERSDATTKEYEDVDPIAFVNLTKVPGKQIDVIDYDVEAQTLKVRETTIIRDLKVESTDIVNFLYTENWTSLDLQGIPFCAERKVDSRSTLIELGYDKKKVNSLKAHSTVRQSGSVRNPGKFQDNNLPADPSQDQIEYYDCYMLIDTDGDGISERRRLVVSEEQLLDDTEIRNVAFAAGAILINPHRFLGVSLYDKLKQTQDISTGLNRSVLDNANATNKSRLVVRDGKVSVDDLEDGRVNGRIRVKQSHNGPLSDAVSALLVPDISTGILANIEHQKRNRAEMGGASLEMASGNVQLASDQIGSQGLDRAFSVMEQLAGMMAKIIAETLIRNTYLLVHATLREFFSEPVNIKRSGKWSTPIPSEWQERSRVNVKIGMSPGERNRKVGMLGSVLDKQITLSDQGLDNVVVNLTGFHNALMDWARAGEIDNPEQYFMDPESDESKAGFAKKVDEQKQAQEQQATLIDQALALERLRTSFEKYKQDTDLQFQYWSANLNSEVEEAKIVGKATVELETARGTPDSTSEKD